MAGGCPGLHGSDPQYSTFKVKTWWEDGIAREICAKLGDPPTTAGYEGPKPTADACSHPWDNTVCDNQEPFSAPDGVGTSVNANAFEECKDLVNPCGTSRADAAGFEFRITQRYAGDNYRVYFYQPGTTAYVASALVTAWKRAYVENDAMCRVGGMLYADPNPARDPDAQPDETTVRIAKELVEGNWVRWDSQLENHIGERIELFDTSNTFEGPHDVAYICGVTDLVTDPYLTVELGGDTFCTTSYYLNHSYNGAVPNPDTGVWNFDVELFGFSEHPGLGGGLCITTGDASTDFFAADPSELNYRDHKVGAFDDAFTSLFLAPDGAGVIPFLPEGWFTLHDPADDPLPDKARLSHLYFANAPEETPPTYYPSRSYFHLIGASSHPDHIGSTRRFWDVSFVFVTVLEEMCTMDPAIEPAPDLATCLANANADTTGHELAHRSRSTKAARARVGTTRETGTSPGAAVSPAASTPTPS